MYEINDWDFDRVKKEAQETWNNELGKIQIKTSSKN